MSKGNHDPTESGKDEAMVDSTSFDKIQHIQVGKFGQPSVNRFQPVDSLQTNSIVNSKVLNGTSSQMQLNGKEYD
jgi:hypothetical protein